VDPNEIQLDHLIHNLILWIPPTIAFFLGTILKHFLNKSLKKPTFPMMAQLIYAVFTGAALIPGSMTILRESILTDFNVYMYNLGTLFAAGATINEKLAQMINKDNKEGKGKCT